MSDYVAIEVTRVRQQTKTEVLSETNSYEGISRKVIVDFLNEADEDMQNALLVNCPELTLFDTTQEISLVANQVEYDLPANIYGDGEVKLVEYTQNGQAREYYPIEGKHYSEMDSYPSADVDGYIIRGNKLVVIPPKQSGSGKIRITYPQQLNRLTLRAGQIASDSDTTITLAANTSNTDQAPAPDATALAQAEYISIVDRNGVVKHSALPVTAYDSGTRVLTGTFTGLTIAANDYVVIGAYATTHSALPRMCERYRLNFAKARVQVLNSSIDWNDIAQFLTNQRSEIVEKLTSRMGGPKGIPISNDYWN